MIVTSTSLVIKMELVIVTESPVRIEDEKSVELLVTEIKLHRKTVENTKHVSVAMEDVVSAEPLVSEIKLHRKTMEHT